MESKLFRVTCSWADMVNWVWKRRGEIESEERRSTWVVMMYTNWMSRGCCKPRPVIHLLARRSYVISPLTYISRLLSMANEYDDDYD